VFFADRCVFFIYNILASQNVFIDVEDIHVVVGLGIFFTHI